MAKMRSFLALCLLAPLVYAGCSSSVERSSGAPATSASGAGATAGGSAGSGGSANAGGANTAGVSGGGVNAGSGGSSDAGVPDASVDASAGSGVGGSDAGSDAAGSDGEAGSSDCAPLDAGVSSDPCLGLKPACDPLAACPDTDGDGLNDAWESAGGVDLDGDGRIDACHDLLLPDADPNQLDVYVQYDWMGYSTPGNACSVDSDCSFNGSAHKGETCTGPQVLPAQPGSCRHACSQDSDCTVRPAVEGDHTGEQCMAGSCVHTHDPDQTSPGALAAVVEAYALHAVRLHLVRGHEASHSLVTSFRRDALISSTCEGSQGGGLGEYAVSLYDLKAQSALDKQNIAYHYALFAHYSGCDSSLHCSRCPAALNPDSSPKNGPVAGQSGIAEISGNDFIVSLGNYKQDVGLTLTMLHLSGTFMHELGHNLGLHHGGGVDTPCSSNADCSGGISCQATPVGKRCLWGDDLNYKPNYLSVMNYRYQLAGISVGSSIGDDLPMSCSGDSDCNAPNHCYAGTCARLDYSSSVLPVGGNTPGSLEEQDSTDCAGSCGCCAQGLNEPAGLGSGTSDIFTFTDGDCDLPATPAASEGPVDWNHDGDTDDAVTTADLAGGFAPSCCAANLGECGSGLPRMNGNQDWSSSGPIAFTFAFQCTPFAGLNGDETAPRVQHEAQPAALAASHLLFPMRTVPARLAARPVATSSASRTVQLFGSPTLNVNEIEPSSLRLGRAAASSTSISDLNGDGRPDLRLVFASSDTRRPRVRLSGWFRSGQSFVAEPH